jgi:peroxiredoxin/predicted 2-oxoglutarate/Fe(II)-dependent dioxygenase YbiX
MPALTVGDHAPWFILPSSSDILMGGYRVVLFFFGSASRSAQIQEVVDRFCAARNQFEQAGVSVFGVSIDPNDKLLEQKVEPSAHFRFLWDFEGELSIRYNLCQLGGANGGITYDPTTFVLDENLRVLQVFPLETVGSHVEQVLNFVQSLPAPAQPRLITQQAPVLLIPNVFQPEFCQHLIDLYEADGGTESGVMQQEGDKTLVVLNPQIKRRRDFLVTDPSLMSQINSLIWQRVQPEIEKAFQFRITCYERYTVACYEAHNQGHFHPHRDNTAAGSAHRRFAMTLNLNSGEYEGGCLRFPEYSSDLYSPGTGGVAIFSCSLLHEATPVTKGRRFALLSFFYDDEDAKLRQQTVKQIVRKDGAVEQGGDRPKKADKAASGFQPKPGKAQRK